MPPVFASVGTKDPNLLVTSVNKELMKVPVDTEVRSLRFARVDTTSKGIEAVYPMRATAVAEKEVALTADRDVTDAYVESITVRMGRIDGPCERIPINEDVDVYGLVEDFSSDMIKQGKTLWDRRVAAYINKNGLSVDNVPMFSGAHPGRPGLVGSPFSNDIVAGSDSSGFHKVWDLAASYVGYDGQYINRDMVKPLILAPTIRIHNDFAEFLTKGTYAKPAGTGAVAIDTRMDSMADVIYMPELVDPSVPGSDKRWYFINTSHGLRRAFILRIVQQPKYTMTTEKDWAKHVSETRLLYYVAYGGVGFGLPHLAIRCTLP